VITENVRNGALALCVRATEISRLVRKGNLIVAGGVSDLNTGAATSVSLDPP
jgi:hypothetical protein